ncbi:MAG TPA: DUF6157 family protein [Candidatus Saccharibacteria bacterium]|nr:DUF6157 family protein [Candidatus Saccharibacteria bacterium]
MTTNYYDTLIRIAEDSPVTVAEVPVAKNDKPTIASMQYDMVVNNPYKFTSDDVIFRIYAERNHVEPNQTEREKYFSKGQPCFRSSPLGKRYGWGVHSDSEGKIAIYPADSSVYEHLANDPTVKQLKAMRSKRV